MSATAEYSRKYRKAHPEKFQRAHLKRRYGITLEQYKTLAAQQKGLCLICEQSKKLVVDHCHKTEKVQERVSAYLSGERQRLAGFDFITPSKPPVKRAKSRKGIARAAKYRAA